jgi:para-nitrobenzyl esterase
VSNREISLRVAADVGLRADVVIEAERKAEQGGAPVYAYYLTWKTPVAGGKFLSPHTLDLPFVFDNLAAARELVGTGKEQQALADRMSGAWIEFARTGKPAARGLPPWNAFDLKNRATMILDNECRRVNDPQREERMALAAVRQS